MGGVSVSVGGCEESLSEFILRSQLKVLWHQIVTTFVSL